MPVVLDPAAAFVFDCKAGNDLPDKLDPPMITPLPLDEGNCTGTGKFTLYPASEESALDLLLSSIDSISNAALFVDGCPGTVLRCCCEDSRVTICS
jgi:hypothetical protein